MTQEQALQVETKEIRGVSLRTVYTIVIATAAIVTTVLVTAANISAQIVTVDNKVEVLKSQKDGDAKLNDLRISIMERRIDLIDEQIKRFHSQK